MCENLVSTFGAFIKRRIIFPPVNGLYHEQQQSPESPRHGAPKYNLTNQGLHVENPFVNHSGGTSNSNNDTVAPISMEKSQLGNLLGQVAPWKSINFNSETCLQFHHNLKLNTNHDSSIMHSGRNHDGFKIRWLSFLVGLFGNSMSKMHSCTDIS